VPGIAPINFSATVPATCAGDAFSKGQAQAIGEVCGDRRRVWNAVRISQLFHQSKSRPPGCALGRDPI